LWYPSWDEVAGMYSSPHCRHLSDVEKHGVVRPGDPDHPLAVTEGGLVHTLVVAGGAAGFAAAFNAPLGGMLYMLEEIALPSGWSARATRGSFVAAASGKEKAWARGACRDEMPVI